MFVELGLVHTDSMPLTRLGLIELTRGGVPWVVNPTRRTFLLPDSRGPFFGLIVEAGTPRLALPAERLGSADTARLAAALEGRDDVVMIGSKVRYDVSDRARKDRAVHEIAGAHDAEMKRNGHRLLELIDDAVRVSTCDGCTPRLRDLVRGFPSVALRHEGVAGILERTRVTDAALLRWFGEKSGRGRPARNLAEERVLAGTLAHEIAVGPTVGSALDRVAATGIARGGLANLRSAIGELYQLSVEGIWVTADRLMSLPWVAPLAATKRWDVYRLSVTADQAQGEHP